MRIIFGIFVYSWIISIVYGLVISASYPIFNNYYDEDKVGKFIPLYNLFSLCALNGYDEKLGLLFLVPFVNILMIMFMSYKLNSVFGRSSAYAIGLLLLPIVFVPLAAHTEVSSKEEKKSEKTKVEKKEEPEVFEEDEEPLKEDDSIFKIQRKTESYDSKPYKAKKVKVNQDFIDSAPAEQETINRVNKDN